MASPTPSPDPVHDLVLSSLTMDRTFAQIGDKHFTNLQEALVYYRRLPPRERANIHEEKVGQLVSVSGAADDLMHLLYHLYDRDAEVKALVPHDNDDYKQLAEGAGRAAARRNKKQECQQRVSYNWGSQKAQHLIQKFGNLGASAWEYIRALSEFEGDYDTARGKVVATAMLRIQANRPGTSKSSEIQPADWKYAKTGWEGLQVYTAQDLLAFGYVYDADGWLMEWNSGLPESNSSLSVTGTSGLPVSNSSLPEMSNNCLTVSMGQTLNFQSQAGLAITDSSNYFWDNHAHSDFTIEGEDVMASAIQQATDPATQETRKRGEQASRKRKVDALVESDGSADIATYEGDDNNDRDHDDAAISTCEPHLCGCEGSIHSHFLKRLRIERTITPQEELNLVKAWMKYAKDRMCWKHLQALSSILGFRTKELDRVTAVKRLKIYHDSVLRSTLGKLKTDRTTYRWFRVDRRPVHASDGLGPYRLLPTSHPSITLTSQDQEALLEILGINKEEWQRQGSVVSDCFQWWKELKYTGSEKVSHDNIFSIAELEFSMYRYHLREVNGKPNLGWLRNMFHSLAQQAMRQDPVYYLIYCALRPDQNHNLVSYPYYAKFQMPGDSTFFRHVDVNISKLVHQTRGTAQIQGAISIDDEESDDCTEILPCMHNYIKRWEEKLRERGLVGDQFVHKITNDHFTADDKQEFSTDWTAQPCKSLQVRITLPHIPHGAMGPAKRRRRTMLPWFCGLQADLQTLELPEAGTWSE